MRVTWVLLFVFGCLPCGAGEPAALEALKQETTPPSWARKKQTPYREGKPWAVFGKSRRSEKDMQDSVGRLRYVIEKRKDSPDSPFLMLELARHWVDLGEDPLGYQAALEVLELPDGTRHNGAIYRLPNLDAVKREARFILVRVLARNRLADQALAAMKSAPPQNGYEHVRYAECVALLGGVDAAKQLLDNAKGAGHPENGFSDIFIRLRAAVLARAMGDDRFALAILEPIHAKGLKSQKWPQWQSTWSILNTLLDSISAAPGGVPDVLIDGVYTAECRGFIAPVEVKVQVRDEKIESVKVTKEHEDRPWSALSEVPERITRRKSLNVDVVTGATVSSCAVIVAADKALTRARK